MNVYEQLKRGFMDADGLVSPRPCDPTTHNATNNGICYTSEAIVLSCLGADAPITFLDFTASMIQCEITDGLYDRSPSNHTDYESVDDYIALMAAYYFAGLKAYAKPCLIYGLKHFGVFNNVTQSFRWSSLLWRDPSLLALTLWASGKRVWFPLNVIVAISILFACMFDTQNGGAHSWRLTWLLVQVAKKESFLCRLASLVWYKRLNKVWTNGMYDVYNTYYTGVNGQPHPMTVAIRGL